MNLQAVLKQGERWIKHRSPEMLVAVGVCLMGTSVVLGTKAGVKAKEVIETKARKKGEDLTKEEFVKSVIPVYAPTIATFAAGAVCVVCADRIHVKRNAALTAAATIAERSLNAYANAVKEEVGEEKEQEIRSKATISEAAKNPPEKTQVVNLPNGNCDVLCYDDLSGRYFYSSRNKIESAANQFNKQMRDEVRLTLNEWYGYLGLEDVQIGDELGWDIDDNGYVDIVYLSRLDSDGHPAMVIGYSRPPKYIGW